VTPRKLSRRRIAERNGRWAGFRCAKVPGFSQGDIGLEYQSVDAAERGAAEAAAAIGQDRLPGGDAREITVEVRNRKGPGDDPLRCSMHVERVYPEPVAPAV
jgi:hypothetical protein